MKFINGTTKSIPGGGTTSAIDTTGADFIAVAMVCSFAVIAPVKASISDSNSNVWTYVPYNTEIDGSGNAAICLNTCANPTVGLGHTFTSSYNGGDLQAIAVVCYKRANGGFDTQSAGGSSSGSFTVQPGSVTPGENNALVLMIATVVQLGAALGINQGFTIRENQPLVGGTSYGILIADLFQSAAAAVNPTLTSNMNGNGMAALSFVFKGAPELVPMSYGAVI